MTRLGLMVLALGLSGFAFAEENQPATPAEEATPAISAAPAPVAAAPAAPAPTAVSKLTALVEKEKADVQTRLDRAKADLDAFAAREKSRLDVIGKRVKSEDWDEKEKKKIKALKDAMATSSTDVKRKAFEELQDNLRMEKVRAMWNAYKTKTAAMWSKYKADRMKLLTSPPLMKK